MRFTVTRKIVAGHVILLLLGILALTVVYRGLASLRTAMRDLADVREPASAAVYEMEINVNGMTLEVLKYLDQRDPTYRDLVKRDESDFERYYAEYMRLTGEGEGRELGRELEALYFDFRTLAQALMQRRDQQEEVLSRVEQSLEAIDDILDHRLQAGLAPSDPARAAKLQWLTAIEADVAEVGIWLARYQRTRDPRYQILIRAHAAQVSRDLAALERLQQGDEESRWTRTVTLRLDQTMNGVQEVMALEDRLQNDTQRFVAMRQAMDNLIDDRMQILAQQQLAAPRLEADRATVAVIDRIRVLLPILVLASLGVSFLLVRLVRNPIRHLARGTQAIGRGDLSYRLAVKTADEFGDLAIQFNRMVAQLQATTVSRELWTLTFDSIDSLILVLDAEGRVRQLNRSARGRVAAGTEPVGLLLEELGAEEPWTTAAAIVREARTPDAAMIRHVRDEVRAQSWEVAVNPFAPDRPEGDGLVVVAREITPLVELQAALHRARTVAALGELVAGVAHEVRNPLFGISSTIDAMEARFEGNERLQRYTEVLRGEVDRLARLMHDLLAYGRPVTPELVPRPAAEVIGEAIQACAPLAQDAEVTIVNRAGEAAGRVRMDRARLVQVFLNLLQNAVQNSPRGAAVIVDIEERQDETGGWALCRVRDHGPGFRPEDIPRATEPFFTRRHGGTGLGLSIVQRIVEEHGGRVVPANAPDGGAVLSVHLPLAPPDTVPGLEDAA